MDGTTDNASSISSSPPSIHIVIETADPVAPYDCCGCCTSTACYDSMSLLFSVGKMPYSLFMAALYIAVTTVYTLPTLCDIPDFFFVAMLIYCVLLYVLQAVTSWISLVHFMELHTDVRKWSRTTLRVASTIAWLIALVVVITYVTSTADNTCPTPPPATELITRHAYTTLLLYSVITETVPTSAILLFLIRALSRLMSACSRSCHKRSTIEAAPHTAECNCETCQIIVSPLHPPPYMPPPPSYDTLDTNTPSNDISPATPPYSPST